MEEAPGDGSGTTTNTGVEAADAASDAGRRPRAASSNWKPRSIFAEVKRLQTRSFAEFRGRFRLDGLARLRFHGAFFR